MRRWEQPDYLRGLWESCLWNYDSAGHTAAQHIDLPDVVGVESEVDSVDCEGLEAGRLDAQRVGANGKLTKLVTSFAVGARSEDSLRRLIGEDDFGSRVC